MSDGALLVLLIMVVRICAAATFVNDRRCIINQELLWKTSMRDWKKTREGFSLLSFLTVVYEKISEHSSVPIRSLPSIIVLLE